ncbi:hypothetical protein ADN00_12205 [Ornatilinea apprima]|uniref:LysM domain-containing protein n=1 Tax=Ornatilinea apprima TaxID=1134406 RepID=A0A0P6XSZ8_9CHLR|nr:LysM domain-containing protein [Ornatilinea apprima]KPL76097.1 hypothetical protein ADN00_12205 [Ornatilinea apprima]
MKIVQQVVAGFLVACVSLGLVIGAFSAAFAESAVFSTATLESSPEPTQPAPAYIPLPTRTPTKQPPPTLTPTIACLPPEGWQKYETQSGDTIEELAARFAITKEQIRAANCLISDQILPNTELYLPRVPATLTPSATINPTATPGCGAPAGWITYTVRLNDNLFRIGYNFGISVQELQTANCLGNTQIIRPGQVLYVPNVATRTPLPSATPVEEDDDEDKKPTLPPYP